MSERGAGSYRCPTCGRRAVRNVVRDVTVRVGRRKIVVQGLEIEECARCGERLYRLEALRRLADARRPARKRSAA